MKGVGDDMKLQKCVSLTETDEGAVLLNEKTGKYWQLNRSGAHALRELLAGDTIEGIGREWSTNYKMEFDKVTRHLADLVEQLREAKLVAE
jgi:hypothetical protein